MKIQLKKLRLLLLRRDKIILLILFVSMLIGALSEVIGIGAIPLFISILAEPDKIMEYKIGKFILQKYGLIESKNIFIYGSICLIVLYIIKNSLMIFNYSFQAWFTKNQMVRLSDRLFSAYMKAPYHFHLQRNTAELLRNAEHETRVIANRILTPFLRVCMHGCITISVLILLCISEAKVALTALGLFFIVSLMFLVVTQKRIKKYSQVAIDNRKISIQTIQQAFGSLKETRILNREPYFMKKFLLSSKRRAHAIRFSEVSARLSQPFLETTAVAGLLLIAVYLVSTNREVTSIIPTLALFALALTKLKGSIGQVVAAFITLRYNLVSVDPVYDDLSLLQRETNDIKDDDYSIDKVLKFQDKIVIENLFYRYPKSQDFSLKDISISIQKGSCIGFVGKTGAGKTTVVDVVLGLLKPTNGRITVDGNNIFKNLSEWQKKIGYIPQFIYLLDDTIKKNIALGIEDRDIDETKIQKSIEIAQLEEFVKILPEGVETVTGEHGIRLSGGQRQRIGIARALYHNPEVLVMDEATSALDNVTERMLVKEMNKLKRDRTIIMIAHRLTTVQSCDKIYFMKDGGIESCGSYSELVELSSEFREIAET